MLRFSRELLRNNSEYCKFFLNIFKTVSFIKTPMGRTLDITQVRTASIDPSLES